MESAKERQGRILLVDDESAILRTFRYCLEDEGYTVATANRISFFIFFPPGIGLC